MSTMREITRLASHSPYDSGVVTALMGAIECKDVNTATHMWRVAEITGLIGLEMELPAQEFGALHLGALLHDIGKIGVPRAVLKKPGPLTCEEHMLMCLHPLTGSDILKRFRVLQPLVPAVRYHHERFDGGGYPEGLRRGEIPLAARVILVADALDAMITNRPYQQGVSRGEALEEIAHKAGAQFDPEVVGALLSVEERVYRRADLKGFRSSRYSRSTFHLISKPSRSSGLSRS